MPSAPSPSRTFSLAVGFLLGSLWGFPGVMSAENLDRYGGFPSLHTAETGYFTVAKFGNRWMFVDPIGNAYFGRGADLISDSGQSAWGNIIRYTTIYTYDASNGTYSSNLNIKAEDLFADDVLNDKNVTVHSSGDVIYIGYGKPFNQTYFNVSTRGAGGIIQWYYSTGGGRWSLLNGSGNPADASALNPDETYNLDTGNWIVPDGNAFYSGYAPNGNLVSWWTSPGRMNADSYWVGDYFQSDTQALKAQSMVDKYRSFIDQPASDGTYSIAGVSHSAATVDLIFDVNGFFR